VKRWIVALLLFLLAASGVLVWLLADEGVGYGALAIVVVATVVLGGLFLWPVLISLWCVYSHAALRQAVRRLEGFTLVRGPLGLALRARGVIDGVTVTISPGMIDLDMRGRQPSVLGKRELRAVSHGEADDPILGELARSPSARAAASRLLALGAHVHVGPERTTIRGVPLGTAETCVRAAIALARGGTVVRGTSAGSTCPYCKDKIQPRESEGVIRCPSCDSLQHTACWQEHGGCSVHGCLRVPGEVPSRSRVPRPD
jgi:hypothetical protein